MLFVLSVVLLSGCRLINVGGSDSALETTSYSLKGSIELGSVDSSLLGSIVDSKDDMDFSNLKARVRQQSTSTTQEDPIVKDSIELNKDGSFTAEFDGYETADYYIEVYNPKPGINFTLLVYIEDKDSTDEIKVSPETTAKALWIRRQREKGIIIRVADIPETAQAAISYLSNKIKTAVTSSTGLDLDAIVKDDDLFEKISADDFEYEQPEEGVIFSKEIKGILDNMLKIEVTDFGTNITNLITRVKFDGEDVILRKSDALSTSTKIVLFVDSDDYDYEENDGFTELVFVPELPIGAKVVVYDMGTDPETKVAETTVK